MTSRSPAPLCLLTSPSLPRGLLVTWSTGTTLTPTPSLSRWRALPGNYKGVLSLLGPQCPVPINLAHSLPSNTSRWEMGPGLTFQLNQKGVGGDASTQWPSTACWEDRWRGWSLASLLRSARFSRWHLHFGAPSLGLGP